MNNSDKFFRSQVKFLPPYSTNPLLTMIYHKSHSLTSPTPSLHQKTRCLGKVFCYFLERVFVRRFPVKQMLIISMCGYKKSDICMFPSFQVYGGRNFTCERKNLSELFMKHFSFYTGNMHRQRKLRTSKNFYLPLLYKAHSYCNKFP